MGAPVIRLTEIRRLFLSRRWRFRAGHPTLFPKQLTVSTVQSTRRRYRMSRNCSCWMCRVDPEYKTSNAFGKRSLAAHHPKSLTYRIGLRPMRASSTVRRIVPYRYHTDGRIEYDRYRLYPLPFHYLLFPADDQQKRVSIVNFRREGRRKQWWRPEQFACRIDFFSTKPHTFRPSRKNTILGFGFDRSTVEYR